MAIDTTRPQSPGWWLDRLFKRLSDRRDHYDLLDAYYDGRNIIPHNTSREIGNSYRRLMGISRMNYAELIVEAVRERMSPVGFRTGAEADRLGDEAAWDMWQANNLDADCALTHAASLSMGMGYVIVGPKDSDIDAPIITPEDPREVIVELDPRRRRKVLAGLKVFADDVTGMDRAYLFLPGQIWRAQRQSQAAEGSWPMNSGEWSWESASKYPQRIVPVVPFPNRPKTGHATRGEFETHLPLLDRLNYTVLQLVEIATLQAFRQRALKGGPTHDQNGVEIDYDDIFESTPGAIWHIPETAELWESQQVDLNPVRMAIRDIIQDIAASTRTPLFYLTPEAANGSAEGAALAREGLIFKTRDRLTEAGEAWEQVMSYAFLFAGDEARAKRSAMEIIWAPPERHSMSEQADAAAKAIAGGMTWRKTMELIWQRTPQEIGEMEEERAAEALRAQGAALVEQVMTGATGPERQPPPG